MHPKEEYYLERLVIARKRHQEATDGLSRVRVLLEKADAQYRRDTGDAKKWHKVLENLEQSLDEMKSRANVTAIELKRLEDKLNSVQNQRCPEEAASETTPLAIPGEDKIDIDTPWPVALNLEEASLLRGRIDAGEIQDKQLEAKLELSNQLGNAYEPDESGKVPRRQLALRAAIDKISQRNYDAMTYDEVRLVLACRSLLTSRLEPTPRDERLKRIIDGASRVLLRKKEAFESKGQADRNQAT